MSHAGWYAFLLPATKILLVLTSVAGIIGIISSVYLLVTGGSVFVSLVELLGGAVLSVVPVLVLTKATFTPRIRLAIATWYIGWCGADLFLLGKEQRRVWLIMVSVFVGVPLLVALLGYLGGGWSQTAILYSLLIPAVVMGYWQTARFFEYLWMPEEDFDKLVRRDSIR